MNLLNKNSIYAEVIESPELKRLKDISFLGILGYCCTRDFSYSTRYEHSLSVANKCYIYAQKKNLSRLEETYLVLAGLLHDIGHCNFSHSLEPVFINRFSISHHDVTKHLILYSSNLIEIWNKYNINSQRIVDTIEGLSTHRDKIVTKMPVNFDTLDGIARTESHFSHSNTSWKICKQVFQVMCNGDRWENHVSIFDSFWQQKERVYSSYIYTHRFRFIELLFQELFMNEKFLNISHYFLSDSEMQNEFPWVTQLINDIKSNYSHGFIINQSNKLKKIGDVVTTSLRRFEINLNKEFSVLKNQRYLVSEEIHVSSI
ncbi:MAG TPA: HD domain-containing protein [Nitrospirae bacterium]|nr:HD domain protein [bacterium BMS3Abin06]HDH12099.1 HD domain-containing protein [Nitrospirota bacterium]HDZ03228.1 HD domain-containing protein [Nitrospirota bacterium]